MRWEQRQRTELHRLDVHVSVRKDVRRVLQQLRAEQLHAGLREQHGLHGLVRLVVQPQVRRDLDLHDDRGPQRERGLLGRLDV